MKIYQSTITAMLSALTISGCTSLRGVQGPSGAKFDLKTVCNTSANSRCSPTVGLKIPLLKQQIVMEVEETVDKDNKKSVRPKLETYLGTMVAKKASYGEPGTYCGVDNRVENPFKFDEFDEYEPLYTNNVNLTELIGANSQTAVQADLVSSLKNIGVSEKTLSKLDADIRAEAAKISAKATKSSVKFVEYRINEEVLRKLEMSYVEGGPNNSGKASCMAALLENKGKKWQLYQGLTGFLVDENRSGSASRSLRSGEFSLSADFKEEVMAELGEAGDKDAANLVSAESSSNSGTCDVDPILGGTGVPSTPGGSGSTAQSGTFSLQSQFNRRRCRTATARSEKYFVAIGLSVWQSPRFYKGWEKDRS